MQACAAVYFSDSSMPQMNVSEVTLSTGSNVAVAAPELQVAVLTTANSAPAWSAPDTRRETLSLQVDVAVKVTTTLSMLVLLLVIAVHSFPTESPPGFATRNTSSHSLPSDEDEELLADGLAEPVALADAVGVPDDGALPEALGPAEAPAFGMAGDVAANDIATPIPIEVRRTVPTAAPLTRVRLRIWGFPSGGLARGE